MSKQIFVVTIGQIGNRGTAKYAFLKVDKAYEWMIENGYELIDGTNIGVNTELNSWARKDNVYLLELS